MFCLSLIRRIALIAMLAALPQSLFADTFSDANSWIAATTGDNCIPSDYISGFPDAPSDGDGFAALPGGADAVLTHSWGTQSFTPTGNPGTNTYGAEFEAGVPTGVVADSESCLVLEPNLANGEITGFAFDLATTGPDLTISILDGATVIETYVVAQTNNAFFGWTNTAGASVTSIEICPSDNTAAYIISNTELCFVDSGAETCQDKLQQLIDALTADLSTADSQDQQWILCAIAELESAQDAQFWFSGDRLSDDGCGFFNRVFYATYYLECVCDESLVEDDLDAIQVLLGCVVDAEIEYALSHPDVQCNLVLYAEYFEYYADQFADAGCYLRAVILHFYAWLFASHAT